MIYGLWLMADGLSHRVYDYFYNMVFGLGHKVCDLWLRVFDIRFIAHCLWIMTYGLGRKVLRLALRLKA